MKHETDEMRRIARLVSQHKSRSRSLGLEATLTLKEWLRRLDDTGGICLICEVYVGISKLTMDHIIPGSRGGGTTWENVRPICFSCNSAKGDKTREVDMPARHPASTTPRPPRPPWTPPPPQPPRLSSQARRERSQRAAAHGTKLGRRFKLSPQEIAELQERKRNGAHIHEIMALYQIPESTAYRYLHYESFRIRKPKD